MITKKEKGYYYIITTMDGVPLCDENKKIIQFSGTKSMRLNAKNLTFKTKKRHHTRGLTKDQWFRAQKYYKQNNYIPLAMLA